MSVLADLVVAIQAGSYMSLSGDLVGLQTPDSAEFEEVHVFNAEWPKIFFFRKTGTLDVTGLIYGAGVPSTFKAATGNALFAVIDTDLKHFGPAGYVALNDRNLIQPNGVVQVAGSSPGTQINGVDQWKYGDLLPLVYNGDRASSVSGYFQAPAGAWCMIHVEKRGSLESLEVRYTIGATRYSLAADLDSNMVQPQLKLGQMVDSGDNAIPAQAAGTWHIASTGSHANSEVHIGIAP